MKSNCRSSLLTVLLFSMATGPLWSQHMRVATQGEIPSNHHFQEVRNYRNPIEDTLSRYIVKFGTPPGSRVGAASGRQSMLDSHQQFEADLRKIEGGFSARGKPNTRIEYSYYNVFNGKAIESTSETVNQLKGLPYVHSITKDKRVKIDDASSNLIIKADQAWSQTGATGSGVVIGVIDTGIDYTHPDLGGGIGVSYKVIGGFDFVNNDSDPMDDNGHGTHVAGIAAANGETNKGVAPDSKLMAFKVLSEYGFGWDSWIIAGIERCADPDQNPATDDRVDVINMSLGREPDSEEPLSEAVNNAVSLGIVVVVAAGNNGQFGSISTPGIAEQAITVGATQNGFAPAFFTSKGPSPSTYGLKPDIAAPGVGITSTIPGGNYQKLDGTSMASPHVAGAAALLLQLHPQWSPQSVKATLLQGAAALPFSHFEVGVGLLDVLKSANSTFSVSPPVVSVGLLNSLQAELVRAIPVEITNYSQNSKTYVLSTSGALTLPGVSIQFSESSVTIEPESNRVVSATLRITPSQLPKLQYPNLYLGHIVVTVEGESKRVPVGFVNYDLIKVHFKNELPGFLAITRLDGYDFKFVFPTSPEMDIVLPQGNYDLIAAYYDHYHIKENVSLANTSELTFAKDSAKNVLVYKPVDDHGVPIMLNPSKGGTAQISMNEGSGFASIFLGMKDTLFVSKLSDKWSVMFMLNDIVSQGDNRFFTLSASQRGVTASKVFTNEIADLIPIKYQFSQNSHEQVALASFLRLGAFTLWNYPERVVQSDFTDFHQKIDFDSPLSSTFHVINSSQSSGYTFQTPSIAVYKDESISFKSHTFQQPIDQMWVDEQPVALDFESDLAYWGGATANSNTDIVLTPWPSGGFFAQSRGSKILGTAQYSLLTNGVPIRQGIFKNMNEPFMAGLVFQEMQPANYTLKLLFENHQVKGRPGKLSTELIFNTALNDKNPPRIEKLQMKVNGRTTNHLASGETGTIFISVVDYCRSFNYQCFGSDGIATEVALDYRHENDENWTTLPITGLQSVLPDNLQAGYYSIRVTASDNSGNWMRYLAEPAFLVGDVESAIPLRRPVLIYPGDKVAQIPQNPIFKWSSTIEASAYRLQISEEQNFNSLLLDRTVDQNSFALDFSLGPQATHFWRVQNTYENGVSSWSEPFSFTTGQGTLQFIEPLSPANGASGLGNFIHFEWTSANGAAYYEFEISQNPFVLEYGTVKSTTFTNSIVMPVLPNTQYYWRVRPFVTNGLDLPWSDMFTFSTKSPTVMPIFPTHGQKNLANKIVINWNDDFLADHYTIEISKSAEMENILPISGSTVIRNFSVLSLEPGTTYYWRVTGSYGDGAFVSDTYSFRTALPNVLLLSPINNSILRAPIHLSWQKEPIFKHYRVEVSSDDFKSKLVSSLTDSGAYFFVPPPGQRKFKWRVFGIDGTDESLEATASNFTIEEPSLVLTSPVNGALDQLLDLTFRWRSNPKAASYNLFVSKNSEFIGTTQLTMAEDTLAEVNGLEPGEKYYWRVEAINDLERWISSTFEFHTLEVVGIEHAEDGWLYPNPASTEINFKLESNTAKIRVTNSLGQPIWGYDGGALEVVWDFNRETPWVTNGIYFVSIRVGEYFHNTKILIKR